MLRSQQAQALQLRGHHPTDASQQRIRRIRRIRHLQAGSAATATCCSLSMAGGGTRRDVAGVGQDCWNLRRKVWKVCQKAQQLHQILEQDSESHDHTT